MRGVELGLADLRRRLGIEPARRHEIERLGQPVGQRAVALALRRALNEILVPRVDPVQVGIAALGEGAQQVQGRRRLAVGLHHALRVGLARRGVEIEAVDDVAAIRGEADPVLRLGVGGARLGELPGEASDFDDRAGGAEGQNDRHLQQDAEGVADVVGVELGKALGAIAALQQEGLAGRDVGEPILEAPRLAGENERRVAV